MPAAVLVGLGNTAALSAETSEVPTRTVAAKAASPATPHDVDLSPEKVAQYRAALILASAHPNARRADLAKRTLLLLDVATAKNAAERRAKIRQLPIEIVVSAATDGRKGTVRSYIAGGKVRLQRFVPDAPPPARNAVHLSLDAEEGPARGPAIRTGIWRGEGNDGCVWDPYAEGADECTPWQVCADAGVVGECSTESEQEAHDSEISWVDYQVDLLNADIAAFNADVDYYCTNNPWACEEDTRGPSPVPCNQIMDCIQWGVASGIAVGAAAAGAGDYKNVRYMGGAWYQTAGKLIVKKVSRSLVGGAIVGAFAAGWSIGSAI